MSNITLKQGVITRNKNAFISKDINKLLADDVDIIPWTQKVHKKGTVVQHHIGQIYKANSDTSGVPGESLHWDRIGSGGFRFVEFRSLKVLKDNDLYVKEDSLYLFTGGKENLLVGRGQKGDRGERGFAGKDGKDGKHGMSIDVVELAGTSLVFIMSDQTGKTIDTKIVDLIDLVDPIAKKFSAVKSSVIKDVQESLHGLMDEFVTQKLLSQLSAPEDIPITSFRGEWNMETAYKRGEAVRYAASLVICTKDTRGIAPDAMFTGEINNAWQQMSIAGGSSEVNTGTTVDPNLQAKLDKLYREPGKIVLPGETTSIPLADGTLVTVANNTGSSITIPGSPTLATLQASGFTPLNASADINSVFRDPSEIIKPKEVVSVKLASGENVMMSNQTAGDITVPASPTLANMKAAGLTVFNINVGISADLPANGDTYLGYVLMNHPTLPSGFYYYSTEANTWIQA